MSQVQLVSLQVLVGPVLAFVFHSARCAPGKMYQVETNQVGPMASNDETHQVSDLVLEGRLREEQLATNPNLTTA